MIKLKQHGNYNSILEITKENETINIYEDEDPHIVVERLLTFLNFKYSYSQLNKDANSNLKEISNEQH